MVVVPIPPLGLYTAMALGLDDSVAGDFFLFFLLSSWWIFLIELISWSAVKGY